MKLLLVPSEEQEPLVKCAVEVRRRGLWGWPDSIGHTEHVFDDELAVHVVADCNRGDARLSLGGFLLDDQARSSSMGRSSRGEELA